MGENTFLNRGIKYNIFGLIPKTSYATQTLNIKYRDIIEHHDTLGYKTESFWIRELQTLHPEGINKIFCFLTF